VPFDPAERPRAPQHPDAVVSPAGRIAQRTLRGIHDHLRAEMRQVVQAVRSAATGTVPAADARALVAGMTMSVNYRALGSFCGQYCAVVDMHHRIEDAVLFPDLRAADPRLGAVLDRLSVEHVTVHAVLVELDRALVEMVGSGADELPSVQDAVERLSDALLDHLAYEEDELLPALGRLGTRV
jgi:hypothetical protein